MSVSLRSPLLLAWGSAQASAALALGATSWMVSGLTPSPLLNALLPAVLGGAALLRLRQRITLGLVLQLLTLLGLLMGAIHRWQSPVLLSLVLTLLAILLWAIGQQLSLSGGELRPVGAAVLPAWQSSSETGRLLGSLLTALLFPLGRGVSQFSVAVVLLIPLLLEALRGKRVCSRTAGMEEGRVQPAVPPVAGRRLLWKPCLQGVLFGALFALLALWVRLNGAGDCVDFGMLLAAYALGRTVAMPLAERGWLGAMGSRQAAGAQYLGMAALLVASQSVPGWAAVALFLPFGLLAGLRDRGLLLLCRGVDGQPDLVGFERSGAIGGVVGSLGMGLLTQVVGLSWALPLQVAAFLVAALVLGGRARIAPAS